MRIRTKAKAFSTKVSKELYPKATGILEKVSIFSDKPEGMELLPRLTLSKGLKETYTNKTIC